MKFPNKNMNRESSKILQILRLVLWPSFRMTKNSESSMRTKFLIANNQSINDQKKKIELSTKRENRTWVHFFLRNFSFR